MDNPLDTLFGDKPQGNEDVQASVTEAAANAPAQETPAEVAPGRARDPSGKFASAAPPVATGEADKPAAPPPAPPPAAEPGHVPISAMLDEREKRQALEKELAAFKERQAPPQQRQPLDDPAVEGRLYVMNRQFSRRLAEKEYGKETVAQVHEWAATKCDDDPFFNQQLLASDDPYELSMQAWKRDQLLAKVSPDDLDEYTAWKAAKAQAGQAQPQTQQSTPQAPPRSLANAPGSGGAGRPHVPVGEGEAFNATFKG